MKIKQFTFNPLGVNTYVIWDESTLEAAIIDCGTFSKEEEKQLSAYLVENNLKLSSVLLTHTHFDHIFGLLYIYNVYKKQPHCHFAEHPIYQSMPEMARQFRITVPTPLPSVERFLNDGDTIQLGNTSIEVIHTPGHTPGGICFYIPTEGILFSGDTLFCESIGRADLPGGNYNVEIESIKSRLLVLPDSTKVYTGHGPSTTIEWEKKHNFYLGVR